MGWARGVRCTVSATHREVNLRAIPPLHPRGWRLYGAEDIALTGAAPKNYLAFGDVRRPDCEAYIAKRGGRINGDRDCVTEEIISKIGKALPVRVAASRLVRLPVFPRACKGGPPAAIAGQNRLYEEAKPSDGDIPLLEPESAHRRRVARRHATVAAVRVRAQLGSALHLQARGAGLVTPRTAGKESIRRAAVGPLAGKIVVQGFGNGARRGVLFIDLRRSLRRRRGHD
jgi:hypothetical protein